MPVYPVRSVNIAGMTARAYLNPVVAVKGTHMNAQLQAFADAWSTKDWPKLRAMAREYVDGHRAELSSTFDKLTLEDMVSVVVMARKQGREADKWAAEAWLLSEFEPQKIVGSMGPTPKAKR